MPSLETDRTFDANELRQFLTAIDRHLEKPARLIILGGAAAAIGYGVQPGTRDVDTRDATGKDVDAAAELARQETGFEIPLGAAGVADYPYHHEDRLVRQLPELRHLEVFVFEKHDLALSKIVRGSDHDLAQIEALHELDPLDFDILLDRYLSEMKYANTDLRSMDINFLNVVDNLFGDLRSNRARSVIEKLRPPR